MTVVLDFIAYFVSERFGLGENTAEKPTIPLLFDGKSPLFIASRGLFVAVCPAVPEMCGEVPASQTIGSCWPLILR